MVNQEQINRKNKLNELSGIIKKTSNDYNNIQKYYDEGNNLRRCQEKFGCCRPTLIKYLKTRSRTKLHEEQKRKKNVVGVVSWRQRTKQKLVELHGGKCNVCGYNKCVRNLHFHHKDPSKKEFSITAQTKSFERLELEASKCVLLCSNCHGEVHDGLIQIPG